MTQGPTAEQASGGPHPGTPPVSAGDRDAVHFAERWPWTAGLALVAAAFAVRITLWLQWPLPFCLLRKFTGIPCPACGSTRSLLAWAHFDPGSALRFNPLFFLVCTSLGLWLLAGLMDRWTRWDLQARMLRMRPRRNVGRLVAAALVLNWVYLCWTLPH